MNALETQVIAAFLVGLLSVIPLAFIVLRNFLTIKANQIQISQRPTHSDVEARITTAIQAAQSKGRLDNGTTEEESIDRNG